MGCGSSKKALQAADPLSPLANDLPSVAAAVVIQSWYKGFKERLELRQQLSWQVFTNIEYQSEVDQLALNGFFADLDALKEALSEHRADRRRRRSTDTICSRTDVPDINDTPQKRLSDLSVQSSGQVAAPAMTPQTEDLLLSRPNEPSDVNLEMLEDLIEDARNGSSIPSKLLMSVIDEAFVLQKTFGNIRAFNSRVARRVTVIGDLHGHLNDLLTIFQMNGIPDDGNPYIFNGDLIDRGKNGIEILAILFALQLLYPHSVFVNRGNHEDYLMNKRYGFEKEVMNKYEPEVAAKLLRAIGALFAALPLATTIDKYALVIHAGIFDKMDLELLAEVQRQHFVSILKAAKAMARNPSPGPDEQPTPAELIVNAVWSDPTNAKGCEFNSARGGGSFFGEDVTDKFLEKYGLSLLVRSHECKRSGYEWTHNDKVLTLFSASNYYTNGTNLGAFAVFEVEDSHPRLVQFNAEDSSSTGQIKLSEQVSAVEKAAYHDVMKQVYQKKDEIVILYDKTTKKEGKISIRQWVDIMKDGTKLSIPWRMMMRTFVTPDEHGMIDFESFLNTFKITNDAIKDGSESAAVQTIASKLYQNLGELEYIFRLIDEDYSGCLSHEEFIIACRALSHHLGGGEEIDEDAALAMAHAIDLDGNGKIEFNEFVESFRLIRL